MSDMKKFIFQVVGLVLIALGAFYFTFRSDGQIGSVLPSGNNQAETRQVRINNTIVDVEVADTQEERSKGLSGRDSLGEKNGMLFVFPQEDKYRFWMKGMKFDLDFIFIRDGKVVDFIKDVPPAAPNTKDEDLTIYQPIEPIDMLLEVNAGFIQQNGINIGDSVYLVSQ